MTDEELWEEVDRRLRVLRCPAPVCGRVPVADDGCGDGGVMVEPEWLTWIMGSEFDRSGTPECDCAVERDLGEAAGDNRGGDDHVADAERAAPVRERRARDGGSQGGRALVYVWPRALRAETWRDTWRDRIRGVYGVGDEGGDVRTASAAHGDGMARHGIHGVHTRRVGHVASPVLRYAERMGRSWRETLGPLVPMAAAVELGEDEPCSLPPVQHAHMQTEQKCVRDFAAAVTGAALAAGIDAQDMHGMGMGAGSAWAAGHGLSRQPVQQSVHCARTHDGFAHARTFVAGVSRASEVQDTVRGTRNAGSSAGGACAARGSAGSPGLEQHEASTPSAELGIGAAQCPSRQDVTIRDRQTDRQNSYLQGGQTDGPAEWGGAQGSPAKVGAMGTGLQEGGPRCVRTSSRDERTRVRRLFRQDTVGTEADGGGVRVARSMFGRAVSGVDGAWRATRVAADAAVRRARRFFFRDAG